MSDRVSEEVYHASVGDMLAEYFPTAEIHDVQENETYLARTGRFPDFLVDHPLMTIAVEVENDADSVIGGVGQAECYTSHFENAVPMLIAPEMPEPETEQMRWRSRTLFVPWRPSEVFES